MVRTALALSLIGLLLFTTLGCTSQPLAPTASAAVSATSTAVSPSAQGRRFSGGAILVTSQELYYDTFVAVDPLPMEGKFQLLVDGKTEFGPGDPGYLGGRWWEDLNENGVQDEGDHFFLCPLLPPGRPTP